GDFVTAWLALLGRSAQAVERFQEKRLDIMRLHAASLSTFHVFPDTVNTARVHGVVNKGMLLDQALELGAVERVFQHRRQASAHFGLIPVAYCLDQKIAKRLTLELELSENIEYLAPQGLTRLLKFIQQLAVNIPFAGLFCHQVPEMTHFGLAYAVDAAETLLNTVGVPWEVIVDHQVSALEVDALAC